MRGRSTLKTYSSCYIPILLCLIIFAFSLQSSYAEDTTSIVFIVDNSASNRSDSTDILGLRFDAVVTAIEKIKRDSPTTNIGLVLFGSRLWFYKPDNEDLFVSVAKDQYHGGNGCYIPPLQLDKTYSGTYITKTDSIAYNKQGIDVLKMYLEKTEGFGAYGGFVTKYTPTHKVSNPMEEIEHKSQMTNITRSFDAANQAHLSNRIRSPKKNHVNIFLSDGLPVLDYNNPDMAYLEDYKKGEGSPTTFTVNYNPMGENETLALSEMTSNIQNNGYSESNNYSKLWEARAIEIEDVLIDSILSIVLDSIIGSYLTIPQKLLTGTSATITWASKDPLAGFNLEYTIDNKNSWAQIATIDGSTQEYSWSVPNASSDSCFIRFVNPNNDSILLESGKFAISRGAITIDEIETCTIGDKRTFTWSSTPNHSNFTLDISYDSGDSWVTISDDVTTEYTWEVQGPASENMLIKVTSNLFPELKEISTLFSVESPLQLIYPAGSHNIFQVKQTTIRWESEVEISSVKLEYTIDSAKTWHILADNVPDTGTYTWLLGDICSRRCKVRISANDNPEFCDEGSGFFQILNGSVELTSPNGGDTLYMGEEVPITWGSIGDIGDFNLKYVIGIDHINIEENTVDGDFYNWTVPDTFNVNCKVRITSNPFSMVYDYSDTTFLILKPTISGVSPNEEETWKSGEIREITWDSKGISGNVTLSYSIGDSLSWIVADTAVPNNGTYNWRVPNKASEKCWVKISHNKYPSINDINDYPFIIEASDLDLVSITADPISATLFEKDSLKLTVTAVGQEPITYQWQKNSVTIPGVTTAALEVLSLSAVDSGAYRCIATNPLGSDTSSVAHIALKDQFISVIYPNGGEILDELIPVDITWKSDIRGYNVVIDYSVDSGGLWNPIINQTEDDGAFQWDITSDIKGSRCLLRISSHLDGAVSDNSDASFQINIDDAILVTDSCSNSEKLLVYPNPVSVDADEVKISVPKHLSGTGELSICDYLGATLDYQRFEFTNGATLSWDLRNSSGVKVASGTYVAVLQVTEKSGEVLRYKILFGVEE